MPFYDLYCPSCDKEYNISATMADKAARQISCPDCGLCELQTVYNAAPAYVKSQRAPGCPGSGAPGCGGCRHSH